MNAKYSLLSLTHHRLVQLLIQKGFAEQNPPPLNTPPPEPHEDAEIPQATAENPQETAEVPQGAAENPQETADISQTTAKTPQLNAENPQQALRIPQQIENNSAQQPGSVFDSPPPPAVNPIDPSTTSTPPHNLA